VMERTDTAYSPTIDKYEKLKKDIGDLEKNIRLPEVQKVLYSVTKGQKPLFDILRYKRVIDKLFAYLDSI
jgi:hypothetical protein